MRICFCGHFTGGGTEKATFNLANLLCDSHNIFILNTSRNDPTFFLNESTHFDYVCGNNIAKRVFFVTKYLKRMKIDCVVSVEAMTGIYTLPAAIISCCKHIVWEHANYFQDQGSKYIQFIRQLELKFSTAYVVLTERDKLNFKRHFKIKCRLEQIYNIAEFQKESIYNHNSTIIMSAGHFRSIKNFHLVPEIGRSIFQKHPDWKWVIYGNSTGPYSDSVKNKIIEYGLSKNIILPGRITDMNTAYQKAAIFVLTSKMEGLPLTILEAKCHHLPIISFNIETGPDEMILDGTNGFLVDNYSCEEMSKKICELIENVNLRIDFSKHAMDNIEKFSKKNIKTKWLALLEDCCL